MRAVIWDLPPTWIAIEAFVIAAVLVLVVLNVVVVLPALLRELWTWLNEALGPEEGL